MVKHNAQSSDIAPNWHAGATQNINGNAFWRAHTAQALKKQNYVQTHELEEAQTEMNGRQDQLQSDFTALDNLTINSKERLDQLETIDHFFEGKLDNRDADHMVAVQQIATESQAVV